MTPEELKKHQLAKLDATIEKLNYDQDFYDVEDMEMAIEGDDGKYYPIEAISMYDKDFFMGKTPMMINKRKLTIPRMLTKQNRTIIPPSQQQPVRLVPTDRDLAGADEFNVTVTKNLISGVLLSVNLPFVLFSPVFRKSNYATLINQFVPTGLTLTVTDLGNGDIRFSYDDGGGNVTALDISSGTTPYRSLLDALMTDRFTVIRTRETIGNTTTISQLSQDLNVSNGSLFGGQSFNKLSGAAQKGPDQQQDGIIDFNAKVPLDKYRAVQSFIVGAAPDGFENIYSFWAEHVVKY